MIPARHCIPTVLADVLRPQPLTPAKLAFCWRLAVGPAIDEITTVTRRQNGEILIETSDDHWQRELERALPLVRNRLEFLLGDAAVARLIVRRRLV